MGHCLIKRNSGLIDVDNLTANQADVVNPYTFYGRGTTEVQVGSIKDNGVINHLLPVNGTYTIPAGYIRPNSKVYQNVEKKNAFSVEPSIEGKMAGAYGKYMLGDITVLGVANLIPENIRNGAIVGNLVGTWRGFVNNDPLAPYWYGIPAPGQSFKLIDNRPLSTGTSSSNANLILAAGDPEPDGQYIYLYAISTCKKYPAFRTQTPIEMYGGKTVSITYSVSDFSANNYTWLILGENEVDEITGGSGTWNISSDMGAYEKFVLPATTSDHSKTVFSTKTFTISNASKYHYVYVGLGVKASSTTITNIKVKSIKINK